jgi:hypothetical protein
MHRAYAPSLRVRLAWWFGIYLASYLWLLWCCSGENWGTALLEVPQGLIEFLRSLGPWFDWDLRFWVGLVYVIYLLLLAGCLLVRSRMSFYVLIFVFVLISGAGSYGFGWCEGIIWYMSDKPAENSK